MRTVLGLVSELFGGQSASTQHRVVVDRVERVRNEPASLSFKRQLK